VEPQKHFLGQLSLPSDDIKRAFSCIMQRAIDLGKVHYSDIQNDDNTTICYSAGLIKLVNIKHITPFAYRCLQDELELTVPDDTLLKFECYHSQHFDAHKSFQEHQFKQVLTRKKNDDVANKECWRELKEEALSLGKNRVLLIVLASPIIDTGRDYDFDFAITEFRDHRGLVQTCGRVLRHRHLKDIKQRSIGSKNPNVLMLDRSLRYYDTHDPSILYSKPGFQDTFNVDKEENGQSELVEPLTSEEYGKSALALSEFNEGDCVNAAVMMQSHANSRAKELELKSIDAVCNHSSMALDSLFSPAKYVSTRFSEQFPFRRSTMDKTTTFAIFDGQDIQQVMFNSFDRNITVMTEMSRDYNIQTTAFVNQSLLLTQRPLIEIMRSYNLDDGRIQTLAVSKNTYGSDIHKKPIFDTILGFVNAN
jgi:hypothetical protein